MAQWLVYSRADCGLCEELLFELTALLGPAATAVKVIDIGGDAALERKYGHRIPVLTIDGDFVCDYKLDVERVKAWL